MPTVTVAMFSDRIQTEKDRLAEAVTRDIVQILNVERLAEAVTRDIVQILNVERLGCKLASGFRV